MFAYLIIGVELVILYTVFWYVFLYEPKPYKVTGPIWGIYDPRVPKLSQNDIDTLILEYKQRAQKQVLYDRRTPRKAYSTGQRRRHLQLDGFFEGPLSFPTRLCQSVQVLGPDPKKTSAYGWVVQSNWEPNNFLAKLCVRTANWIENLSVKIP